MSPHPATTLFTQTRANPPKMFKFDEKSTVFFAWQFLPVASAVCLGFLWSTVDVTARRLEPFYQLSLPNGAPACASISEDYMSCWIFLLPFKAAKQKHWAVVVSSTIRICVETVLPALQGGMWKITWKYEEGEYIGVVQQMNIAVIFSAVAVNAVVIILATLEGIVCQRKSGLISDPGGITALASLICNSPRLLHLLRTIPSYSSQHNIDVYLQPFRFKLQYLTCTRGDSTGLKEAYQIVPIVDEGVMGGSPGKLKQFKFNRQEAHPISLRGWSTIAVWVILMIPNTLIRVAATNPSNWSTWTMKGLLVFGCTLTISFSELQERDLRLMEAYYQAQDSTVGLGLSRERDEFLSQVPLVSFFSFLHKRATILAFISFYNFILQILIIINPTLDEITWDLNTMYGSDVIHKIPEVFLSWYKVLLYLIYPLVFLHLSLYISMALNRRKPILPRKPNTISSNLVYLCNSIDLLEDVRDFLTWLPDRRYDFGWVILGEQAAVGFARREKKSCESFVYGELYQPDKQRKKIQKAVPIRRRKLRE